jgi:hypothetical protein
MLTCLWELMWFGRITSIGSPGLADIEGPITSSGWLETDYFEGCYP